MQTFISSPPQFKVSTRRRALPFTGGSCSALAGGSGAEAAALAAFATLNTYCNNATGTVNQNPLGPYGTNGSCTHDCSYEQTWWWKADYRPTNNNLNASVSFMNMGNTYNAAFQPTQTWVSTHLPGFNTSFTGDINTILQIDAAIISAGGNETPAQVAQLSAAFTDAASALLNNINEANRGLQSLAGFVNNSNPFTSYMQTVATNAQAWIKTNATGIENSVIGQIACGAGDVQNSFNAMFADVAVKLVNMQAPFNSISNSFQLALQAAEKVAGIFLSLQAKSQLVSQYIADAQALARTNILRKV
jgi:hypothetical protein